MLIHWDFSEEQLRSFDKELIEAFAGEMIRAKRLGHHIISISRRTASWIINSLEISNFTRVQLEIMSREYTQTGNLRKQASIYLEIAPFAHDFEVSQANRVDMSINCTMKHNVFAKSNIIVENIDNDGWFIDFVFQGVRSLSRLPKPAMHFLHGGGGDILRVLKYECEQKSIVCAFMDSDKKAPSSHMDQKVQDPVRICSDAAWPLSFVEATPCHEIENFLPFSVVSDLAKHDSADSIKIIQGIIEHERLNSTENEQLYWRWFDIKNGFTEACHKHLGENAINWHCEKIDTVHNGQIRYIKGFGEFLIQRSARDNKVKSALIKALNSREWIEEFREFFLRIGWIFAAQKAKFT
ncbi:hypothetical protein [Methylorubrum aminovorans]|uniref:hypothetical protein n=1 Tax=Methylorubrum aminovorans TaxID=269069 RepID=UPI003C3073A2